MRGTFEGSRQEAKEFLARNSMFIHITSYKIRHETTAIDAGLGRYIQAKFGEAIIEFSFVDAVKGQDMSKLAKELFNEN